MRISFGFIGKANELNLYEGYKDRKSAFCYDKDTPKRTYKIVGLCAACDDDRERVDAHSACLCVMKQTGRFFSRTSCNMRFARRNFDPETSSSLEHFLLSEFPLTVRGMGGSRS